MVKCTEPTRERYATRGSDKFKFLVTECSYCNRIKPVDKQNTEAKGICEEFNTYRPCKLDKSTIPNVPLNTHPFDEELVFIN